MARSSNLFLLQLPLGPTEEAIHHAWWCLGQSKRNSYRKTWQGETLALDFQADTGTLLTEMGVLGREEGLAKALRYDGHQGSQGLDSWAQLPGEGLQERSWGERPRLSGPGALGFALRH